MGPPLLGELEGEGAGERPAPEPAWIEALTAVGFVIAVLIGVVWALVLSHVWTWPPHRL